MGCGPVSGQEYGREDRPCYQNQTGEPFALAELQAKPSPVKMGIGPGEVLEIRFDTSLGDGSDIFDYLAAFERHMPWAQVQCFPEAGHYLLEDAFDEVYPHIEHFLASPLPVPPSP